VRPEIIKKNLGITQILYIYFTVELHNPWVKQHTKKFHNITFAKKQNIFVKYFFQKFWLRKLTIVTEKN
jgi:hypothetical protein